MHSRTSKRVLDYEVAAPSHMLLNIEAARCGAQARAAARSWSSSRRCELQAFCDEGSGNRFVRFDAAPGPLKIRYQAQRAARACAWCRPTWREVPVNAGAQRGPALPDADALLRVGPDVALRAAAVRRPAAGHRPGAGDRRLDPRQHHLRAGQQRLDHHGARGVRAARRACAATSRTWASPSAGRSTSRRGWWWAMSGSTNRRRISMRCSRPGSAGSGCCSMPTRMAPVDRLVRVGTGRDAKDVAFCTIFGAGAHDGQDASPCAKCRTRAQPRRAEPAPDRRAGGHREAGACAPQELARHSDAAPRTRAWSLSK